MPCRVIILDCDWFKQGDQRLIKQVAFCDVKTKTSHLYKLTIPSTFTKHAEEFAKQARHSHGLDWTERGDYMFYRIDYVLNDIAERLGEKPANLCFWTKGLEKARILSAFGYSVKNLEFLGCPRFDQLNNRKQCTLLKTATFALWFETRFHV